MYGWVRTRKSSPEKNIALSCTTFLANRVFFFQDPTNYRLVSSWKPTETLNVLHHQNFSEPSAFNYPPYMIYPHIDTGVITVASLYRVPILSRISYKTARGRVWLYIHVLSRTGLQDRTTTTCTCILMLLLEPQRWFDQLGHSYMYCLQPQPWFEINRAKAY